MKTYPSDRIRNVVLVGHGGVGKTSLAEALLFTAGAINRVGRVEDGNTVTDFDPDEIKKQISISLATAPFEWKDHKVNLLDAPGYADFAGEAEAGIRAADAVIIVVSAVDGVQVQARFAWDLAEHLKIPRAIVINKIDRERASFQRTLDELTQVFGIKVAPLHLPIGEEADFHGVVDLLDEHAVTYDGGKKTEGPVPDELQGTEAPLHEKLVESVVEADDDLMERYLEGGAIEPKEIAGVLARGIAHCISAPVLCVSATKLIGVDLLADFIVDELPSPLDRPAVVGEDETERAHDPNGPLTAHVFKTLSDPYVGRISYLKVESGTLRPDSSAHNASRGHEERISQIFAMRGKTQETLTEVPAGDIAAIAKLAETQTGDTLTAKGDNFKLPAIEFPEPLLPVAIVPKTKGDEDKLSTALHRLESEDPTVRVERNQDTHQTLLWGMGEAHIEVIVERLARQHVAVETLPARVAYLETIRGKATAQGKHVKQSGGRGQYAVCWLEVSPLPRGGGFEYEDAIVGGAIPNNYIPSVEKGVRRAMEEGALAGYRITDVKAKLYDGKFHPVDSSDIAFQMAGIHAFKDACREAHIVLLEPIADLSVIVPDDAVGDIMGDLSSKRGRIEGTEPLGRGWTSIKAKVPQAEVLRYAIDLRSKTGGRGAFTMAFSHYEEAPPHVQEKVVAEAHKAKEEQEKK
ncbi:MAG: elongation factor G [Actinomycetota bacterium]|nr:elongation factor G [Actinomycetota bacterium]